MYRDYDEKFEEENELEIKIRFMDALIRILSAEPQWFECICSVLMNLFRFIKREQLHPYAGELLENLSEIHATVLNDHEAPRIGNFFKRFLITVIKKEKLM